MDYINELHDAMTHQNRDQVGEVLDQLVEYTMSHFAFEEELLEESLYPFIHAHQKVHKLFTQKMLDFQQRFELGEDVGRPLMTTLRTWLINHIKRDDADYATSVKLFLETSGNPTAKRKGFFARLFG